MWLRDPACKEVVELAWNGISTTSENHTIQAKVNNCQDQLQWWNKNVFGHIDKQLKDRQEKLQQLESLNTLHEYAEDIQRLRKEINELMDKENDMWHQRSRALWMQEGDRNTKFFHSTATQRRRKNTILGLQDDFGCWRDNAEDIETIVLDYYTSIFQSDMPSTFAAVEDALEPKVTPEMNAALLSEFHPDEVKDALQQMHPLKSPGPDGMPPVFYQKFWNVVGSNVTECVLSTLNSGTMPSDINATHICLIPKKSNPQKITDYRPISLSNVLSRIISKVLANRLKQILLDVISTSQSAFLSDRLITDNVLVAFETMHHINQRRKGKDGLMAIKLDMSKAFD